MIISGPRKPNIYNLVETKLNDSKDVPVGDGHYTEFSKREAE